MIPVNDLQKRVVVTRQEWDEYQELRRTLAVVRRLRGEFPFTHYWRQVEWLERFDALLDRSDTDVEVGT